MGDLTEGVQTVISLLKNSSTGIGSSGYEITDDDSSGLTIADGEILVTASLSKDELRDQFGGSQDYDVIIVVRSEEIEDEWIGFTTKQWTEKVIIEVNVIDKWSAVATKYITGDLVRYKVVNAIRKFIKAKTRAPGGTINKWEMLSIANEADKTTRPVTYKAIITTEVWMYYNPDDPPTCSTGEQIDNGDFEYGNFGGWVNDGWEVTNVNPISDTYSAICSGLNRILRQDLNILVGCFTASSTGQFKWTAIFNCSQKAVFQYKLTFSNGYVITSSQLTNGSGQTESFIQDILDEVDGGNISVIDLLENIKFYANYISGAEVMIDDLTIVAEG